MSTNKPNPEPAGRPVDSSDPIYSAETLAHIAQQPQQPNPELPAATPRQYKHWPECNGDRRFPAGEPGHCCSCFNTRAAANPPAKQERGLEQIYTKVFRLTWQGETSEGFKSGFRYCKDKVLDWLKEAIELESHALQRQGKGLDALTYKSTADEPPPEITVTTSKGTFVYTLASRAPEAERLRHVFDWMQNLREGAPVEASGAFDELERRVRALASAAEKPEPTFPRHAKPCDFILDNGPEAGLRCSLAKDHLLPHIIENPTEYDTYKEARFNLFPLILDDKLLPEWAPKEIERWKRVLDIAVEMGALRERRAPTGEK